MCGEDTVLLWRRFFRYMKQNCSFFLNHTNSVLIENKKENVKEQKLSLLGNMEEKMLFWEWCLWYQISKPCMSMTQCRLSTTNIMLKIKKLCFPKNRREETWKLSEFYLCFNQNAIEFMLYELKLTVLPSLNLRKVIEFVQNSGSISLEKWRTLFRQLAHGCSVFRFRICNPKPGANPKQLEVYIFPLYLSFFQVLCLFWHKATVVLRATGL